MRNTTIDTIVNETVSRYLRENNEGWVVGGIDISNKANWPKDSKTAIQFASQFQNKPTQGAGWLKNISSQTNNTEFVQHIRGLVNQSYGKTGGQIQNTAQNNPAQNTQLQNTADTNTGSQQTQPELSAKGQRRYNRMANRISRQQERMNRRMSQYDKNGVDYKTPMNTAGYSNPYTDIQSRQNRINKIQQKQNRLKESIGRIVREEIKKIVE